MTASHKHMLHGLFCKLPRPVQPDWFFEYIPVQECDYRIHSRAHNLKVYRVKQYAVREVGALVGSGPDGVPARVKRGSKVDFIDSVSVTCYQVR